MITRICLKINQHVQYLNGHHHSGSLGLKNLKNLTRNLKSSLKTSTVCYQGGRILHEHQNLTSLELHNIETPSETSVLGLKPIRFLHGHQNGRVLNLLNHKNLTHNLENLSKISILGQQQRFLHSNQHFETLNLIIEGDSSNIENQSKTSSVFGQKTNNRYIDEHSGFGSSSVINLFKTAPKIFIFSKQQRFLHKNQHYGNLNLKNDSNNFKTPLKTLILCQQQRFLHKYQHYGNLNLKTHSNNFKASPKTPIILGQQPCRYLHGHQHFVLLNSFNLKNLSYNLKSLSEPSLILSHQPRRFLKLMEYQGDEILQATGIPTGKFVVVKNADEAEKMAASLGVNDFMVKAQVLTGGRGKGKFKNSRISGVRIATSAAEVGKTCKKMLGDYLVTKQTSEDGIICNAVLVAERHFPRKEFYFAITMHRAFDGPVVIASTQGGMDIEEVAIVDPEAVLYEPIDPINGLQFEQALEITKKLQIVETPDKLAEILVNLYKIFEKDAILVELNPLALDIHNNYMCLDCKMEFDESADYKQPDIFAKKDISQLDARELAAVQQNINYIALNGNIGCMVNGAGLAMATMDIIKLHGGEPANFLDVGGGATVKTVETCFEIITSNKQVDCIFVNIFGGIMRCDVIAQGIVTAAHKLKLKHLPIVTRLRGTNVAEAKAIIAASEMRILSIDDLDEGAKVAVKVSKIRHLAKEVSLDVNFELIGI